VKDSQGSLVPQCGSLGGWTESADVLPTCCI
jgi:hypothetical protein